ncbi:MAG: pyruvate dehydrogenase complex dihydrolipoamide acetyltransferase, partial [Alphaproteobacteria bacterium]|nr:pyruvate dehydrogenase complex dihydrolipoamide acetyltransferase [Alphaproteobacteria bacterium]
MPINILMPALSPTMEKGNLAKWLKKEGDQIKSGDVLAEIETDKATMEVEAVDEGILAKIVIAAGTADVPVNTVIGVIAAEGEDAKSISAAPAQPAQASPAQAAPAMASAAPVQANIVSPAASAAPAPHASSTKAFASPLARRLAKDSGLDLGLISGTGPHGRIIERDVKAALSGGTARARPAAPAAPSSSSSVALPIASMSDEAIRSLFEPGSYEEIPHETMRKTIARRLVEAKSTIPHFYLTVDCELDALLAAREAINLAAPKGADKQPLYKVSVNDFIIKALAMALQRVPDANVTWTQVAMLKHRHSDIGVAVSIPGGLITPVIRKAETKGLSTISTEMK